MYNVICPPFYETQASKRREKRGQSRDSETLTQNHLLKLNSISQQNCFAAALRGAVAHTPCLQLLSLHCQACGIGNAQNILAFVVVAIVDVSLLFFEFATTWILQYQCIAHWGGVQ